MKNNRIEKKECLPALISLGSFFIKDLDENLSYNENRNKLIKYFNHHLEDFLGCLSLNTYDFIKQSYLNLDKHYCVNEELVFNEDFIYLIQLGVINPNTLRLTPGYRKIVGKIIDIKDIDNIIFDYTIAKGYLDVYGYFKYSDIVDKFSFACLKKYSANKMRELYQHNGLINRFAKVTTTYVMRKEIVRDKKYFLKMIENVKDYVDYPIESIINFASSFDLNGKFPFDHEIELPLRMTRLISMVCSLEGEEFYLQFFPDRKRLEEFKKYNDTYPKWVLKGDTLRNTELKMYEYDDPSNGYISC